VNKPRYSWAEELTERQAETFAEIGEGDGRTAFVLDDEAEEGSGAVVGMVVVAGLDLRPIDMASRLAVLYMLVGDEPIPDPLSRSFTTEEIARAFHDEYEAFAESVGWKTQEASRTSFEQLPPANREAMVRTVQALLDRQVVTPGVSGRAPHDMVTISVSLESAKSFCSDSAGWGAEGLQHVTEALERELEIRDIPKPYLPDPEA
jgi:hypothetical protein